MGYLQPWDIFIHGALHGFHGRTLATMSASGKPGWDKMIAPQVEGFPKAEINDLESARALMPTSNPTWCRTS